MSQKRAISYISAFELNPEEELYLIECDVRRKSCVEIADKYHTTVEVVKRRKVGGLFLFAHF